MTPTQPNHKNNLPQTVNTVSSGLAAAGDGAGLSLPSQLAIIGRHCSKARIFPCQPDKKPYPGTHGFKDASNDPEQIAAWWTTHPEALVGMATGGGVVVIDLDVKNGKDGFAELKKLESVHGPLPSTLTVETLSGGVHLYFWYDPLANTLKSSADKLAEGVDVRAQGGYVITPPSAGYSVKNDMPLAQLPDSWVKLIEGGKAATTTPTPAPTTSMAPTGPDDIDVARECLHYISAACSRDTWIEVGMAMKSAGLSYSEFDGWSRTGGDRYAGERGTLSVWQSFKGDGVSIATLVYHAKQNGYRPRRDAQRAVSSVRNAGTTTDAPAVTATTIEAYYDANRKEIMVRNADGDWNRYTETQFKRQLKAKGVSALVARGEFVSDVDKIIVETQDNRSVVYTGTLAGWNAGVHETDGGRILVTKGPELIEPAPGSWENLKRFFVSLLGDQITFVYGWIKIGVESLRSGSFRPGQALAICGPKDCGKSLAQLLFTELFGGRFARPYQYMAGKTEFNADMFTAEHLAIEDDVPSTKLAERRIFGAKIKEFTANQGQRLHAKGRDAIILDVFWRMTITVNDEPENLMILPPIDESLVDKIMLLKASRAMLPCDTTTTEGRDRCWSTLSGEIPAFLHWLASWQIPVELQSGRYGVKEYHHPEILQTLAELSPEAKLEQLIDTALFSGEIVMAWSGSATELEAALTSHAATGYEARRLLSFNTACGVYLSRLANKRPDRYVRERHHVGREWVIKPPSVTGVTGFSDLFQKSKYIKESTGTDISADNSKNPVTPDAPDTPPPKSTPDLLTIRQATVDTPEAINLAFDLSADMDEAQELMELAQ